MTDETRMSKPTPHQASTSARARKRLTEGMTAAVLFGLVGMITGGLSLYITWRTTSEESAVVLNAYPTASRSDLTHAGFGVRVQLVNKSLRPVVVEGASLWVDGNKISDAVGYLDDARLLDRAAAAPAAITEERLDLPVSLGSREGRSLAMLMDVWRPIVTAETPDAELNARNALNQFLTSVGSLGSDGERNLELGLQLAPGGFHRFPLRRLVESGSYPEAVRDAGAVQRQAPLQNWLVAPLVRKTALVGLSLRRKLAGGGQVDLVDLDVWREGSLFHRRYTRPVLGQQAQLYPLELPKGRYIATFRLGGKVVAYRSFRVPWVEARCRPLNSSGPVWCLKGPNRTTPQPAGQRPSRP